MQQTPQGKNSGKKRKRPSDSSLLLQLLYCFETPNSSTNVTNLTELFRTCQSIGQQLSLRRRREFLELLLDLSHSNEVTEDQMISMKSFVSSTSSSISASTYS